MRTRIAAILGSAAFLAPSFAAATPDPNADVVRVRVACDAGDDDCFDGATAMTDLTDWIWATRNPTAGDRLLVDVGVGEFGSFDCPLYRGYVTVRGAGRLATRLSDDGTAVTVFSCQELEFTNLTIRGGNAGVEWKGSGSGRWTNVDIRAEAERAGTGNVAWKENWTGPCIAGSETTRQVFVNSRIRATGANGDNHAYLGWCSQAEFTTGEILLDVRNEGESAGKAIAVYLNGVSSLRVTSSPLRSQVTDFIAVNPLLGVKLEDAARFEMTAGIINTSVQDPGPSTINARAIVVRDQAVAYVPEVGFTIAAGSTGSEDGVPTRLKQNNDGRAESPFLWQAGVFPPVASDESNVLDSVDGQDQFVEIDCKASGECDDGATPGDEAHLMLYNEALCDPAASPTGEPWFDVVTGRCRNDTTP